jgi:hypothetical protein
MINFAITHVPDIDPAFQHWAESTTDKSAWPNPGAAQEEEDWDEEIARDAQHAQGLLLRKKIALLFMAKWRRRDTDRPTTSATARVILLARNMRRALRRCTQRALQHTPGPAPSHYPGYEPAYLMEIKDNGDDDDDDEANNDDNDEALLLPTRNRRHG